MKHNGIRCPKCGKTSIFKCTYKIYLNEKEFRCLSCGHEFEQKDIKNIFFVKNKYIKD